MARSSRDGSHFLWVFQRIGRRNPGASDDWAHLELFTERALQIVRNHLKLAPWRGHQGGQEAPQHQGGQDAHRAMAVHSR